MSAAALKDQSENEMSRGELAAAHRKWLWRNGFTVQEIALVMSCTLQTAYNTARGIGFKNTLPIKPEAQLQAYEALASQPATE